MLYLELRLDLLGARQPGIGCVDDSGPELGVGKTEQSCCREHGECVVSWGHWQQSVYCMRLVKFKGSRQWPLARSVPKHARLSSTSSNLIR